MVEDRHFKMVQVNWHSSMTMFSGNSTLVTHFGRYRKILPFSIARRNHSYSGKNTICVFAQPRGGSTWFTNLLMSIPGTARIDEPLFRGEFVPDGNMPAKGVGKIKHLDTLNFYYHQPIPEDAEYPEAKRFFDRLFRHQYRSPYLFEETPLSELNSSTRYVFKFCQGNLLLPWLIRHFDVKPIVLLRNPYAVIASQMRFYSFQKAIRVGAYRIPQCRYSDYFEPYQAVLETLSYPEEILAARWCLNYLPIVEHQENNRNWLTISYEGLLMNTAYEIARLEKHLERTFSDLNKIFHTPSEKGHKTAIDYQSGDLQIMSWKKVLKEEEISRIEEVLHKFNIRGYNQSAEPDYDVIYNSKQ